MSLYRGWIIARLLGKLGDYVRQNPIGYALAKVTYQLSGDNQPKQEPAISFVGKEKGMLTNVGVTPYMPDLAVEVQSPDQSDKFMADKAAYYLANGSRMVWLVYPGKHLVEVLTPTDRQLLTDQDALGGGEVLPGFSFPVRDLFAEA